VEDKGAATSEIARAVGQTTQETGTLSSSLARLLQAANETTASLEHGRDIADGLVRSGRGAQAARSTTSSRASPRRKERPRAHASEFELPLCAARACAARALSLNEAFRVAMVVGDRAFLEGHEFLIVERIFALAADHKDGWPLKSLSVTRPGDDSWLLSIAACSISRSGVNQKPCKSARHISASARL